MPPRPSNLVLKWPSATILARALPKGKRVVGALSVICSRLFLQSITKYRFYEKEKHQAPGFERIGPPVSRDKLRHEYRTWLRPTLAISFDPFDFTERFCCEVSRPAVWARDQGDVFDQKKTFALTESFRDFANARSRFPTIVTN